MAFFSCYSRLERDNTAATQAATVTKECSAMNKDDLIAWGTKNGWQLIGSDLCLMKPPNYKDAIVRFVLKGTVVNLEIRKPIGKWEKITGVAYNKIEPDAETGFPRGLGLEAMNNLNYLMEENKNRMVFAKMTRPPASGGLD
jgi:hypothetical protein